jgi:hypothetical protein
MAIAMTIKDLGYAADEVLGIGAAQYLIYDLIIFLPGGLGTASGKSVGGESVLTILDKCNIRYLTLIFSLRSTWTQPYAEPCRQTKGFFVFSPFRRM